MPRNMPEQYESVSPTPTVPMRHSQKSDISDNLLLSDVITFCSIVTLVCAVARK